MYKFLICAAVAVILISVIEADYTDNNIKEENNIQHSNFNSCKCSNNNCGCCEHVILPRINVNAIVCSNITYLPDDYGISVTVTYNSHTVINETVSVRNPPPFCIGQPFVDYLRAELCIRLHDMDFDKHHLHGCVRIEAELYKSVIAKYEIGCFNIARHNPQNLDFSNKYKIFLGKLGFLNQNPVVNMI